MKFLAFALLVVLMPVPAHAAFSDFGRSVTSTLSFFIGDSKSGDVVSLNKNYALAEDSGSVGIASKSSFGTRLVSDPVYDILQLRQPLDSARFIIFSTGTSNSSFSSFYPSSPEIPRKTIADRQPFPVEKTEVFVRLVYREIDLISPGRWVSGLMSLRFVNEGKSYQGSDRVSIDLVQ